MAPLVKVLLATSLVIVATSGAVANCVAPTAPGAGTAVDYQRAVDSFIRGGCFLKEWTSDIGPHLTGSTVIDATGTATTYSVHDQIRVYYSPAMLTWLQNNRPDGTTVPAQSTLIPDGAAMVAAIYPISATLPLVATGYVVMIRQAGNRASDPASGWFFSQIVMDAANYGGTSVTSSIGNYSLGLCVACHASAVNNLTFASFANTKKLSTPAPLQPELHNAESQPVVAVGVNAAANLKVAAAAGRWSRTAVHRFF